MTLFAETWVADLARALDLPINVVLVLGSVFVALGVGSVFRLLAIRRAPRDKRNQRIASLGTWWVLGVVFATAVLLGPAAVIVLMGIASFLGLREYLTLTSVALEGGTSQVLAYSAVPLNYLWIYLGWYEVFWVFVPLYVCLLFPARRVLTGTTTGFIRAVGCLSWGVLLLVFCLSHAAMFLTLPPTANPQGGVYGWFIYLVLLTETDDIAQALWGRKFGRRRVTPTVSPNKTWEGLVLGVLTTVVLAVALAPVLTPMMSRSANAAEDSGVALAVCRTVVAGLIIAIGGFFGDITMSAVKRDLGVKDSGTMLPGMGGILDRIDSLAFSAPLLFYYVYFLTG
jgi:phosphatidate cytidylyltransferase